MKTKEQIKKRSKEITGTLYAQHPSLLHIDIDEIKTPDVAYLRGYIDALTYALVDKEIVKDL